MQHRNQESWIPSYQLVATKPTSQGLQKTLLICKCVPQAQDKSARGGQTGTTQDWFFSTQLILIACELYVAPGAHCPPSGPHRCRLSSAFYEELLPVPKQPSGTHSHSSGYCPIFRVYPKAQCRPQPSYNSHSMQNAHNQECPSKICKLQAGPHRIQPASVCRPSWQW